MLAHGEALPPARRDATGGLTVSVHVRAGDACDLVSFAPLEHSWETPSAETPKVFGGASQRYCVHPTVHLAALAALRQRMPISAVFLATDSDEAANLFRSHVTPSLGIPKLEVRNFARTLFEHGHGWIESRPEMASAAQVTVSGLEDLRLLARGHALIGTACSFFTAVAARAAAAHRGVARIPFFPLDECKRVDAAGPPHDDVVAIYSPDA